MIKLCCEQGDVLSGKQDRNRHHQTIFRKVLTIQENVDQKMNFL